MSNRQTAIKKETKAIASMKAHEYDFVIISYANNEGELSKNKSLVFFISCTHKAIVVSVIEMQGRMQ